MTHGNGISIELEGVIGRYGRRRGVGPVSARWEGPGIYWITGPNGSGKSTLLRLAAGLKRPSEGRLRWRVDGRDLARGDLWRRRALTTPGLELYDELSLRENLEFIAGLRGLPDPEEACERALADAGLSGRADESPRALSSGLRQRVKLSLAWMGAPAILLLDEPSSNLDTEGLEWLEVRVRRRAEEGLCVVATNRIEVFEGAVSSLDLGAGRAA